MVVQSHLLLGVILKLSVVNLNYLNYGSPTTAVGVSLSVVVPSPSCPL